METHDIVVECAKLSLDPIEGTREMQGSCERLQHDLQRLRVGMLTSGALL